MSWQVEKLDDICTFVNGDRGKNYPSTSAFVEEGIPFINAGNLSENRVDANKLNFISRDRFNLLSSGKIRKGDFLFCLRGSLGKFAIVDNIAEGAIASSLVIIRGNERVDTKYLLEYLRSSLCQNEIKKFANGAAQPNLSAKDLGEFEIPLPPLNEQKRIAAILDKADSLRRKRQQAIQLADQFLRSVFLDLFGDPVTNPKGWEIRKWKDALTIINGKNQRKVEEENGIYPIYGSGGEMGRANDYLCNENTIIIGRKGNINKPILVAEKYWNVDTAFGLDAHSELLSYQYLYWFCIFFDFEKLNKTVTIPSLTKSDLFEIKMPIPPIELQIKFTDICQKINEGIIKTNLSLQNVNNLFDSLSQKAFAGEL